MTLKSMADLRAKIDSALEGDNDTSPATTTTPDDQADAPPAQEATPPAEVEEEAPPAEEEVEQTPPAQEKVAGGDASFSKQVKPAPAGTPAFTPSKVVKVLDKEHQIDDFVLAGIKTPEQEKKIKELYEKAHGMDHIKEKNQRLKEQYESVQPELHELRGLRNEMGFYNQLLQKKDYHTFFRAAKIPDEEILKVAHHILKISELTPEAQVNYNNDIESRQRLHNLELENQQFRNHMQSEVIARATAELENVLTSSEVAAHVSAFDARLGAGSFKREVINRAAAVEQESQGQKVLTAREAVDHVLKLIGATATPPAQPPVQPPQAPTQQGSQNVSSKPVVTVVKPTIPNVQAGATSPAKKAITSIADLRKRAEAMD